jgi:hypothetical protein
MTNLINTTKLMVLVGTAALFAACGGDDNGGGPADASTGGAADASTGGTPDAAAGATTYTVSLTRAMEIPACASGGANASGMATVMIPADNASIVVSNFTYTGLSGTATLGHIHSGATGVAGPVVLNFGTGAALTSPINKTFVAADYVAATGAPANFAAFVTALKAGNAYLNIHTSACGPGEIRGQIQ